MLKQTGKIIVNGLLFEQEEEYIRPTKIKSRIQSKKIDKVPFEDQTNKIASIKNQVKAKNLQLIGYEQQVDENDENPKRELNDQKNTYFEKSRIVSKKSDKFVNKKSQKIFAEVENDNMESLNTEQIQQNDQNIVEQNFNKIGDTLQISVPTNRKIFHLEIEDSSDSNQNQNQQPSQKQQQKDEQIQATNQNIFQIQYPHSKKSTKFAVDFSDDSSEEISNSKQAIVSPRIQINNNEGKKFILNSFNSSSDQQEEQKQKQQEKQQDNLDEENLEIVRNINMQKLKHHYEYTNADPNYYAFCQIPPESKISLIIKRNVQKSEYIVYDNELVCQVMRIEKTIGGTLKFHLTNAKGKQNIKQIGKMKGNFLGTQFHCYSNRQGSEKYQCLSVKYDVNILGLNGPRKLKMFVAKKPILMQCNLLEAYEKNKKAEEELGIKVYESKNPKWNSELNAYVLNLRGTAIHSSIKNCIIVDEKNQNKQFIILGKKAKDIFNLQIKHPMSVFQGVAFAISSFQKKLACE